MYSNKLVLALKSKNQVLREFKDQVYLPFGSEYSIFIKNLNSVRCLVSVFIDGKNIAGGDDFVIRPNSSIDIERFITNGNMDKGNRFKFIERTPGVESHRGVQAEDGLIRIEFKFEKVVTLTNNWNNLIAKGNHHDSWQNPYNKNMSAGSNIVGATDDAMYSRARQSMPVAADIQSLNAGPDHDYLSSSKGYVDTGANNNSRRLTKSSASVTAPVNEVGITAPGSISEQQFKTVSSFPTEDETHVMILRVVGKSPDRQVFYVDVGDLDPEQAAQAVKKLMVEKAVTVKDKQTCKSCGKVNKVTSKFCTECGTSLNIV